MIYIYIYVSSSHAASMDFLDSLYLSLSLSLFLSFFCYLSRHFSLLSYYLSFPVGLLDYIFCP